VAQVIAEHQPHEAAIEETFVNQNPSSTLKLGHARAAAMIPRPRRPAGRRIRRDGGEEAVVGTGNADKAQVAFMIRRLLPPPASPRPTRPTPWRWPSPTRTRGLRIRGTLHDPPWPKSWRAPFPSDGEGLGMG